MSSNADQLLGWMESQENEHLEFKEAKASFEFEEIIKYCAAMANEGGGHLILGVTDKKPRRVVGSQAFSDLERTKAGLVDRLHLRVDAEALNLAQGRVVIFEVPSRPLGYPIPYKGAYWMRAGGSLVPMTPDMLKNIFSETGPDFSAEAWGTHRPVTLNLSQLNVCGLCGGASPGMSCWAAPPESSFSPTRN